MAVREVLAHAYHRVDLDLHWGVATVDLPKVSQVPGPLNATGSD